MVDGISFFFLFCLTPDATEDLSFWGLDASISSNESSSSAAYSFKESWYMSSKSVVWLMASGLKESWMYLMTLFFTNGMLIMSMIFGQSFFLIESMELMRSLNCFE